MRFSNRNRNATNGGTFWELAVLVVAFLGIITFQAVRALNKPNTRDYRPQAYDVPRSRPLLVDFLQSLGSARLVLSGVAFLSLIIGFLLTLQTLSGALAGRGILPFVALIALSLIGTFLSYLTLPQSLPFTALGFFISVLSSLFVLFAPALVTTFLCAFLVVTGVTLLRVTALPGHERDMYRIWIEIAAVTVLLTAVAALARYPGAITLAGGCVSLTLLGAAVLSSHVSDTERLIPFVSFLLVLVGTTIALVRSDNSLAGVVIASGALVLFGFSLLRSKTAYRVARIPGMLFTDGMVGMPQPTLTILPAKRDFAPQVAGAFVSAILNLSDRMTFSIVARGGEGIVWTITPLTNSSLLPQIAQEVRSHAKGAEIVAAGEEETPTLPIFRQVLLFALVNDYAAPLPFAESLGEHDPLVILTQRMSTLTSDGGERATYQVVVTSQSGEAKARAYKRLQQGKIRPIAALWQDPNNPISGLNEKAVTAKLEQPLYHCFIAVIVESRQQDRLPLLAQAARDVEQFYFAGHNRLVLALESEPFLVDRPDVALQPDVVHLLERWKREQSTAWRQILCVLSAPEIAALWHLPSEEYESDEIAWAHGRVPEALFDPTHAVPLGETSTPGMRGKTVYVKATDRATHHYIAGKPKAGKSTLMLRLIQADIAAGNGLAVIDPHGKLIADILKTSIPPERLDDVMLLELRRADYPVPLNPFRIPAGMTISQAYNYLLFALQKIYAGIWLPGQTELYIQNMVQLLLTDSEATPIDIQRVFRDDPYRTALLEKLKSERGAKGVPTYSLHQFWQLYDGKKGGEQDKILTPIINRTGAFTHSELLELMTCHPYTLDYRGIIRDKKIVLIDLSGDEILQDVDNLATLLLSGFFLGSYSLGALPDDAPPRYYLYVDEIERTVSAPLPHILSESRKYGLAAILANQFMGQIPDDILEAILGTVGISTIFQVGIKDARFLAPQFEPELTDSDLSNLDLRRVAVKMRLEDKTLPAMILNTAKPKPIANAVSLDVLRKKAEQGLTPAEDVRLWLSRRYSLGTETHQPRTTPTPTGTWIGTVTDME